MIQCTVTLVGTSPYSQSRAIQTEKPQNVGHDEHALKVWREHIHTDENDNAFIPPNALKNCLSEVAKYLSESVPGKRTATFTKHFEAGLFVMDPMMLGVKGKDVESERLFLPSDGKRGGGKRVWKTYPIFRTWTAKATIYIVDPIITPAKLEQYLEYAGQYIGLGRLRPRNNGFYGRFKIEAFESTEVAADAA